MSDRYYIREYDPLSGKTWYLGPDGLANTTITNGMSYFDSIKEADAYVFSKALSDGKFIGRKIDTIHIYRDEYLESKIEHGNRIQLKSVTWDENKKHFIENNILGTVTDDRKYIWFDKPYSYHVGVFTKEIGKIICSRPGPPYVKEGIFWETHCSVYSYPEADSLKIKCEIEHYYKDLVAKYNNIVNEIKTIS